MEKVLPYLSGLSQRPTIKWLLLLIFLVSSHSLVSAENNSRGYLVTKNGMMLTGMISQIFGEEEILFINDFGTPYKIHAALVFGFVVPDQGKNVFYASKFSGEKWYFMRLLFAGEGVNLYSAQINQVNNRDRGVGQFGIMRPQVVLSNVFFVELKGRLPVQVSHTNFKKNMRKLLRKEAPELADKIGAKGYRFKNLEEIVGEYNAIIQKKLISL